MTTKFKITRSQAVELALAELDGPIPVDDFCQRVLAIYPSTAKRPLEAMRAFLREARAEETLIFLDTQTLLPLRIAMGSVRFRLPISRSAAKRGTLTIEPAFRYFKPAELEPADMQLHDDKGHPLPVRVTTVRVQVSTPIGAHTVETTAFDLGNWFRRRKAKRGDSILVTIEDWTAGVCRLDHERSRESRRSEIRQRDQELADLFFDMLEAAKREKIHFARAVPTAYARLSDPSGYPGSHWLAVLDEDPRMRHDGRSIHYGDWRSPLDDAFSGSGEEQPAPTLSAAQARQVYRFKAALRHRSGLWRMIEIQGEQTLGELDIILRSAFDHDIFDHLSGFWKRVQRGKSKRYREIDLGTVSPFTEGSASATQIGGLGFAPGQQLKYVYDFGDWIEHKLTLEEISEPEPDAEYPLVTGQNRPRYRNCVTCKAEGRKARAIWICYECSGEEERDVLLCEDCLGREHEDHYASEILY